MRLPRLPILRFGDRIAMLLYCCATMAAMGNGVITPLFSVIFGDLVNCFTNSEDVQGEVNRKVLQLVYISVGALLVGSMEVTLSGYSTKRQVNEGRITIMNTVVRKSIPWHQENRSTDLVVEIFNRHLPAVEKGLKSFIEGMRHSVTTLAGLIVAFNRGPILTSLVLSIVMPCLFIWNYSMKKVARGYKNRVRGFKQAANSLVRETFSQIKTISSFNLEDVYCAKYRDIICPLAKVSVVDSFLMDIDKAIIAGIFSFSYAVAIYYGAVKVASSDYTGGEVLSVLFAAIMAGFSASQAIPCFQDLWVGNIGMDDIFELVFKHEILEDMEKSSIEGPFDTLNLGMDIEFLDVDFEYPTGPQKPILQGFNLTVPRNSSAAIVGPSGSGKSTVLSLLIKHFNPSVGKILVDGHDLSSMPNEIWRSMVAFIPQATAIFSGTILENIRLSLPQATPEEVIEASKKSMCHDFIQKMPQGYSTLLDGANSLSGGQRQRIGIARAFLRNAQLLLLDEATSALDNKSELEIQETMARVFSEDKTVITVAHKLSTVINMDMIAVLKDGKIIEHGTHEQLMSETSKGFYHSLVETLSSAHVPFNSKIEDDSDTGNIQTKQHRVPKIRESILHKRSVRLSLIPENVRRLLEKKDEEVESQSTDTLSVQRMVEMLTSMKNSVTVYTFLLACIISSCAMGLQYPAFSLALSGSVEVYLRPTAESIKEGGSKWGLIYTGIGFGCMVFGTMQACSQSYLGHLLEWILKDKVYGKAIQRPVPWHETEENDQSAMLSLLTRDTQLTHQVVSKQLPALLQTAITLLASIVIAFTSSVSLTLVIMSVFPLLLIAQFVQAWIKASGYQMNSQQMNRFAIETTKNIKEIHTFSLNQRVNDSLRAILTRQDKNFSFMLSGLAFGMSQFMLYNTIGLAFWYGTQQVKSNKISVEDLMRAFCSLFFATFSIAQTNEHFGNMKKAKEATIKISQIIDYTEKNSHKAILPHCQGDIMFQNVTFAYPSRPDRLVFKHFDLCVQAKSRCALVGESGHGKSSCFGLLEMFYSPIEGNIRIDGVEIDKLDRKWIRSIISFVTQDPVIFAGSVFENIIYGDQNADLQRVIETAKVAHCHEFITDLPNGYDTMLGEGCIQLSGGQRQRIAIARALLKKCPILLMDEPTAALDHSSELKVQQSLKNVMQDKTCIVVAHRLNTVKDFDTIAAVYRGRVLEKGTHQELLDLDGYYSYLIRTQSH